MSLTLLGRHCADSLICFGPGGARRAGQLAAYAHAIARALPASPASARETPRVVLACRDRYHFTAGLCAAWMRGLVAELPANGQPATVHALSELPGVLALLHDQDGGLGLDVRTLEQPASEATPPLTLALEADSPAVVAYTSGSTGQPAAHAKTLGQLVREPEAHIVGFDLGGRRVVVAVPPYHIYGLLFGVLVPLLGGGSFSRGAPLLPGELLAEIERVGADVLVAVPPHLAALAEHEADRWPRLHRVFSSAAPLSPATSDTLRQRGLIVTEVLGSTETGGIASRSAPVDPWRPLPGVRFEVDAEGTLHVDSPWLAPDAPRPYRTADRVEPSGQGFRHLGRSDAVVKVGGRRIDLGEIETRLKQIDGVRDARVLAIDTTGVRGAELLAVVESESVDAQSLRKALAVHIDPVAVPRRFRVVAALPRSPAGKIRRDDLLALFDVWTFPREVMPDGRTRFMVPVQSGYFRGHFEGQPILPGVVQLKNLVLDEVRRRFPQLGALARMTRVKFKRLVAPGEVFTLTLVPKGESALQFALEVAGAPAASGVLHFQPAATRDGSSEGA